MDLHNKSSRRGDVTRQALISAAISCFARDGFHAVSLREIADIADVNQALVSYHFRNKEGLYLAVFGHITSQIRQRIDPIAEDIASVLAMPDSSVDAATRRERYESLLRQWMDGMLSLMAHEQSADWSLLIVREQQSPTAAFALLYDGFMARVLDLMTQLVRRLAGLDSDQDARLMVMTLIGQILVFRFARAGALRHLRWDRIGVTELAAIQARVHQNVSALISHGVAK